MEILTRELWAHSTTDLDRAGILHTQENITGHLTLYFGPNPGRDITAHISLSKISGTGTARAYIPSFTKFVGNSDDPINVHDHFSGTIGELPWLIHGETSTFIRDAHSITFTLGVSNLFAYATCLIFVHPLASTSFTMAPVQWLSRMLGRIRHQAAVKVEASPLSVMDNRVIYDAKTGDILSVHQFAALTGVPLPNGSQLSAAAQDLAHRRAGQREADTGMLSVSAEELQCIYACKIDVGNQTVVSKSKIQPGPT